MNPQDLETTLSLVRGAQAGDRKALDDLFARYLPKVRRIVSLRLSCPLKDFAAYEDVVQDSLLRAFEKLDQFKEQSEGSFYNWIATCVHTAVSLHFKKIGAKKRGSGKEGSFSQFGSEGLTASIFACDGPGPRTRASNLETEEKIEVALLEMKSHHREAIVLRHICGMSSDEVAQALGFSSGATARKVLERAMADLRLRLGSAVTGLE